MIQFGPNIIPVDMHRFCVRCRNLIDAGRTVKGSAFCSTACKLADKKARRAYRASKSCRLCGRAARKARPARETTGQVKAAQNQDTPGARIDQEAG